MDVAGHEGRVARGGEGQTMKDMRDVVKMQERGREWPYTCNLFSFILFVFFFGPLSLFL